MQEGRGKKGFGGDWDRILPFNFCRPGPGGREEPLIDVRPLVPGPGLCIALFLAVCLLAGCYEPAPPERVFIPGPESSTEITISVSTTKTIVEEPVILHAARRSTGFVEIPYREAPDGVRWWRQMPPAYEKEVAGNLRWFVTPEGKARFNTDFRKDFTREVRFPEPGVYELYAESALYGAEPVRSRTIIIEVIK